MYAKLLHIFQEKNIPLETAADLMGVSMLTLRRKIRGESEFNLFQINIITRLLSLDNKTVYNLFFDNHVS